MEKQGNLRPLRSPNSKVDQTDTNGGKGQYQILELYKKVIEEMRKLDEFKKEMNQNSQNYHSKCPI